MIFFGIFVASRNFVALAHGQAVGFVMGRFFGLII
jgi:hypothetical protein